MKGAPSNELSGYDRRIRKLNRQEGAETHAMHIAILYNLTREMILDHRPEQWDDWEVAAIADEIGAALAAAGHPARAVNVCAEGFEALKAFDLIFNLAENTAGCELGELEITRRLEELGMVFTGTGSAALAGCADKARAKALFIQHGLPTPAYQVFEQAGSRQTGLAFPLMVKPLREDGSAGIGYEAVVRDQAALERRVAAILGEYQQPALVEEFIDGREISASLIGDGKGLRNLPLVEEVFDYPPGLPRIVTFEAKWLPGSFGWEHVQRRFPTDLDSELEAKIKAVARQACQALGCRDYMRVDLRLRGRTPYVLEVNPNPCLNQQGSSFLNAARAAGMTFEAVVNEIVALAVRRQRRWR